MKKTVYLIGILSFLNSCVTPEQTNQKFSFPTNKELEKCPLKGLQIQQEAFEKIMEPINQEKFWTVDTDSKNEFSLIYFGAENFINTNDHPTLGAVMMIRFCDILRIHQSVRTQDVPLKEIRKESIRMLKENPYIACCNKNRTHV